MQSEIQVSSTNSLNIVCSIDSFSSRCPLGNPRNFSF